MSAPVDRSRPCGGRWEQPPDDPRRNGRGERGGGSAQAMGAGEGRADVCGGRERAGKG